MVLSSLMTSQGNQSVQSLSQEKHSFLFNTWWSWAISHLDTHQALMQCHSHEMAVGPRAPAPVESFPFWLMAASGPLWFWPQPSTSAAQAFCFPFFLNEMPGTDSLVLFSAEEELTADQHTSLTGDADAWAWTHAEGCFQSAEQQTGIWLFGLGSSWIWSCWSFLKIQLPRQYLFPLPNVQY